MWEVGGGGCGVRGWIVGRWLTFSDNFRSLTLTVGSEDVLKILIGLVTFAHF